MSWMNSRVNELDEEDEANMSGFDYGFVTRMSKRATST